MKRIAVLGSTGSIGTSTLGVVEASPDDFEVVGLAAGSNVELLRSQIRRHRPRIVSVADAGNARTLAAEFEDIDVVWGVNGLDKVAGSTDAEIVVVAVVGAIGIRPTMAAVSAGKDVALANKECMVAAGDLVMAAVERAGTRLLPVDSEHSALHQLLDGKSVDLVARVILTASGGPFRSWSRRDMETATVRNAVDHPTWRMGAKISVDSATLMNKGLEIIEAHHLFGVPEEHIGILVHPQSLIHGMVEWADGSITAQMAAPDMRLPIAQALHWPQQTGRALRRLDLAQMSTMTFEEPDLDRFPAIDLARAALRAGGDMPAVLNAANEAAVRTFLAGRCSFPAIIASVADTLDSWSARSRALASIEEVLAVDEEARKLAMEKVVKYGGSVKYDAPAHGSEKRC